MMSFISLLLSALFCVLLYPRVSHATAFSYAGTAYSIGPASLSAAKSCNAAKHSWVSHYGNLSFQSTTYETATVLRSATTLPHLITETFPANPTPFTLCDGYPRINGSTSVITSTAIKTQTITSSFTTAAPKFGNHSPPNCSIGRDACSILWDLYWMTHTNANIVSGPICGTSTQPPIPSVIVGDPVCWAEVGVKLLYWPVETVPGNFCHGNVSTVKATPTGAGPNIAITLGTTFTSPTVYMSFKGTWSYYQNGHLQPSQTDWIIPMSSKSVSSVCALPGDNIGPPQPVNYANFNYPVPASAYQCQLKCFTDTEVLQSALPSVVYNTTNQCSTIWNDYAPMLHIPAQFRSMSARGGLARDGCFFSIDPKAVLYDPPTSLVPQITIDPVSLQAGSAATTTAPPRQTATPSSSPKLATASQTGVTAPDPQTTLASESGNDPKSTQTTARASAATLPDPPKPSDPDPATSSTRGIGGVIASIMGVSTTGTGNGGDPSGGTTDPVDPPAQSTGTGNGGNPSGATTDPADPPSQSTIETVPAPHHSAQDPTRPSTEGQGQPSSGPDDPTATSAGSPGPITPTKIITGAVFTGAGGTTVIASDASGHVALGSVTLTPGQVTSVNGVGYVSAISSGVVVDGSTRIFTSLDPYTTEHESGAVFTGAGGTVLTASGASGHMVLGSATLTYGQSTSLSGIGNVVAVSSGVIVDGTTRPFSDVNTYITEYDPSGTEALSGAVLTGTDGAPMTASEGSGYVALGSVTLSDGQSTSIQGLGGIVAISSGIVVNGKTQLFSNVDPQVTPAAATMSGAILTAANGKPMTASEGSGYVALGSVTLNDGQSTSVSGLGEIVALSSGIVVNGKTQLFSGVDPTPSAATMSGAILTAANGKPLTASEGSSYAVIGTVTVVDGETTSIRGLGTVVAESSGIVVNGTTHLFSNVPANPTVASGSQMAGSAKSTASLPTSSADLVTNDAPPSFCGSSTLTAILVVLSALIYLR